MTARQWQLVNVLNLRDGYSRLIRNTRLHSTSQMIEEERERERERESEKEKEMKTCSA